MLILLKWICYFKYRSQNFNWIIQIDFLINSHLFRLYKNYVKEDKKKTKKNQNKIHKCAKNRIK